MTILLSALAALQTRYQAWRQRQQAFAELAQLDDRSLADIGISRSEIPYVLAHPAPSRAPAWAKTHNKTRRHSHAH